jgi:hypothetical protein
MPGFFGAFLLLLLLLFFGFLATLSEFRLNC